MFDRFVINNHQSLLLLLHFYVSRDCHGCTLHTYSNYSYLWILNNDIFTKHKEFHATPYTNNRLVLVFVIIWNNTTFRIGCIYHYNVTRKILTVKYVGVAHTVHFLFSSTIFSYIYNLQLLGTTRVVGLTFVTEPFHPPATHTHWSHYHYCNG